VTETTRPDGRRMRRAVALGAGVTVALALTAAALAVLGTGYAAVAPDAPAAEATDTADADVAARHAEITRLERRLARTVPRGKYIVVDRTNNQLSLRQGEDTLLLAVCSAGSGATLRDPGSDRQWVFSTPRGRFEVLSKIRNPVWRRPDWAFIEAGEPIPTDPAERFQYGALGEFALDFGDGYLIHGTLYERLLGRSVTHGCIRLGRDDLRQLYAATSVGTPIYIF